MEKLLNSEAFEGLISSVEALRLKTKKRFLICLFIGLALLTLGIVLFVVAMLGDSESGFLFLGGPILAVVGIVLMIIAFAIKSGLSGKVHALMGQLVDSALFDNVTRNRKVGLSRQEVLGTGFFIAPDRFESRNFVNAGYKGLNFKGSSYILYRRQKDSQGHVTYVPYSSGTIYIITLNRVFQQSLQVVEAGTFGSGLTMAVGPKVETEYIAFNRKFKCYASDQQFFFYVMTPQVQEKIMAFENSLKGEFHMAIKDGNHLYLAIEDQGESAKVPLFKPFDKEVAKKVLLYLSFPAIAIDELDLTSNKYQPNAGVK